MKATYLRVYKQTLVKGAGWGLVLQNAEYDKLSREIEKKVIQPESLNFWPVIIALLKIKGLSVWSGSTTWSGCAFVLPFDKHKFSTAERGFYGHKNSN